MCQSGNSALLEQNRSWKEMQTGFLVVQKRLQFCPCLVEKESRSDRCLKKQNTFTPQVPLSEGIYD